jgi:hypothetical protein
MPIQTHVGALRDLAAESVLARSWETLESDDALACAAAHHEFIDTELCRRGGCGSRLESGRWFQDDIDDVTNTEFRGAQGPCAIAENVTYATADVLARALLLMHTADPRAAAGARDAGSNNSSSTNVIATIEGPLLLRDLLAPRAPRGAAAARHGLAVPAARVMCAATVARLADGLAFREGAPRAACARAVEETIFDIVHDAQVAGIVEREAARRLRERR